MDVWSVGKNIRKDTIQYLSLLNSMRLCDVRDYDVSASMIKYSSYVVEWH